MSIYTTDTESAAVHHGLTAVYRDGVYVASFKWHNDAAAYIEHREKVEGFGYQHDACNPVAADTTGTAIAAAHDSRTRADAKRADLSPQQIAWAKGHDWFRFAGHGQVVVWDSVSNDMLTFGDIKELRDWAGY